MLRPNALAPGREAHMVPRACTGSPHVVVGARQGGPARHSRAVDPTSARARGTPCGVRHVFRYDAVRAHPGQSHSWWQDPNALAHGREAHMAPGACTGSPHVVVGARQEGPARNSRAVDPTSAQANSTPFGVRHVCSDMMRCVHIQVNRIHGGSTPMLCHTAEESTSPPGRTRAAHA